MLIQARILPGLCAVHNFIRLHDQGEIKDFPADLVDPSPGVRNGTLAEGIVERQETERANLYWDRIAQDMWVDYQREIQEHSLL